MTGIKYKKVLPRDLFNEAKLLKSLGHLSLLCSDDLAHGIKCFDSLGCNDSFKILLKEDGYLYCTNVWFQYKSYPLMLKSLYNSKNNYTLFCEIDYEDVCVFDEDGKFTPEFEEKLFDLE